MLTRTSVDEHRAKGIGDGADVAAQQLGDGQADVGDKGQQHQGDEHAQVERQGRLDHLFHRALCNGRADEQDRADRRSQQADAAVQHHDDTELDGVDANGGCNGQQDGGSDQDDGGHIHDAAQNQNDDINEQGDDVGVIGHAGDGVCGQIGHMQHGQAVAEHRRSGDQDQDDGQGVHTLVQSVPDALPIQALVNEHGHEQGVDNGDGCGLCGGEHAAHNTKDNDDNGCQRPDGSTQLLNEALDAEGRALGVVFLDGDDVGADHQDDGQQSAGQVASQEQAAHGDAAGGGGVDDHVMARRNQQALAGGGDGDSGGEVGVVALIDHHGDHDGADGGGICGSRTGNAAEEVGSNDIDHCHAAAHPADAGVSQSDQLFGDAAAAHEDAHGDEEGDGHQAEGRNALDHQTADIGQCLTLHHHAEHAGQTNGVCDGETQEDHDEEADKKDNDCQCLDCHISSPPLQKSS